MKNNNMEDTHHKPTYSLLDEPYEKLLAGITLVAYKDLFSNNEAQRKSAMLYFRDNPYNLSEKVMEGIEMQFNKEKKERGCKYAEFNFKAN